MIRLALLDDHLAAVSGLRRVLVHARDVEVLAAAADEVTLARELRGRRPDILIVGYEPARGDALSLCRRVKARPGAPRVLLYTAYAGAALTIAARIAQADGLLDTSESAGTVIDVIRRMAGGEVVMPKVSRRAFEAAVARLDDRDQAQGSMSPRRIA
jgi:DNA-binding NarL/FixJ family response regulator